MYETFAYAHAHTPREWSGAHKHAALCEDHVIAIQRKTLKNNVQLQTMRRVHNEYIAP